jgi:hypothetical protein
MLIIYCYILIEFYVGKMKKKLTLQYGKFEKYSK